MKHTLPTEGYTPFSVGTLQEGKAYEKICFTVNRESHEKAVSLLIGSMESKPPQTDPYPLLLPSELWAMARVFSRSFGRLNEVALARSAWRVCGSVAPCIPVTASGVIGSTISKGKLTFCTTKTETLDAAGNLLIQASDKIIMIHDCEKPFFVEPPRVTAPTRNNELYRNRHVAYFRYDWDPKIWINNIHTDIFARTCGFEKGLPEFTIFMDWIYHAACQCCWVGAKPFLVGLTKILPIYNQEIIDVIAYPESDCLHICLLRDGMERIIAKVKIAGEEEH